MENIEQYKIPIVEGINDYPVPPNYNDNGRGPNGSYFTTKFNSLVDTLSNYTTSEQSNSIVGVESAGQLKYYGTNNSGIAGFYSLGSAALTSLTDYATAIQGTVADTALQPNDIGVSVQGYDQYTIIDANYNTFTTEEKNKLTGIATGAEVNVQSDWTEENTLNSSYILNKPTLGSAAATDSADYATATQGSKADSALQPSDNISNLTNDSGYVTAITAPVTSVASKTGAVTLIKSDVGLDNVDNTSDLNKPISTGTQNALNLKADLVGGKIPNSQLPSLAITEYLGSVLDQSAMLALVGQRGDWCNRTDTGSTFILVADGGDQLTDWQEISTPLDSVSSVNGFTGAVVLVASDVGAETSSQLNTRDTANRSRANHTGTQDISTVTGLQTALDSKIEAVPFGGFIEKIEDKTYPLFKPDRSYLIKSLRVKSDSGTCTWAVQIDGVNVTGLNAVSVSSAEQFISATGANIINSGDRVTVVSTANNEALNIEFTLMLE